MQAVRDESSRLSELRHRFCGSMHIYSSMFPSRLVLRLKNGKSGYSQQFNCVDTILFILVVCMRPTHNS
jgi:hypothetical protein